REAVQMIEFDPALLLAPAATLVGKGAAAAVALEHRPLDGAGDVARPRHGFHLSRGLSWLANLREPLLRHAFDERVERLLHDRSDVPVWYPMAQEVLCLSKLVAASAARGELKLEGLPRERLDHGPTLVALR